MKKPLCDLGVHTMFHLFRTQPVIGWILRPLLISGLCLTLAACGGSDSATSNGSANSTADVSGVATEVPLPASPTPVAASQKSGDVSSTVSASTVVPDGLRPDVQAFIAGLTASDAQRSTLYQAARAMQNVLGVNLGFRSDLQAVVNDLAKAKACLRMQWAADSEASWNALTARTYDTLLRRLKQAVFLVASRLFTKPPTDVSCTATPPATGDETGGGAVPPPPPPAQPSVAQQLGVEIARLEQQGVLPTLDRSIDVRGPDTNGNGVRDDIDAYVAALSLTDTQRKATLQTARNLQSELLVDPADKSAVKALSEKSIAATKCMADVFDGATNDWSSALSLKIEAITANTPERAQRYIRFMAALSGTSVRYPRGNTCED